jgi:hypothetical protein
MPTLFKQVESSSAWKSLPSVVSWFQPRFFMQGSKRETLWETVLDDGRTLAGGPRHRRAQHIASHPITSHPASAQGSA